MRAVRVARNAARRLAAPVAAQGVTALTSLVLQVIAARTLGLAGFGLFALLLGLLVAVSALYTGYVGDSLAVLDRHDPAVRGALVTSALLAFGLVAVAGIVAVLIVRPGAVGLALAYAVLAVLWLLRETVRRLLIARQEFGRLLVNDCLYLVLVLTGLAALGLLNTVGRSLGTLFDAMTIGAALTTIAGMFGLRSELRRLTPGLAGMRELASFASWRAGHAALRPLALLAARVLVGAVGGLAAVGLLEAGRLVVAPLQVVVNGAGTYLLPRSAAAERGERRRPNAARMALMLAAGTLACGMVLAALAGPLGELMAGTALAGWLVLGWAVYLAVWAAGLPYVAETVARRLSRPVFTTRLADSLAGLALVAAALPAGAGVVSVPWLMAAGGLYSVFLLHRLAARTRA